MQGVSAVKLNVPGAKNEVKSEPIGTKTGNGVTGACKPQAVSSAIRMHLSGGLGMDEDGISFFCLSRSRSFTDTREEIEGHEQGAQLSIRLARTV